jgi:hypothetical protein
VTAYLVLRSISILYDRNLAPSGNNGSRGWKNLAQDFVGPASIVSKTSYAVADVSISRNKRYDVMNSDWHLKYSLNAPSNLDGLSVVQALQLGKDLLVSLHEISELVYQP